MSNFKQLTIKYFGKVSSLITIGENPKHKVLAKIKKYMQSLIVEGNYILVEKTEECKVIKINDTIIIITGKNPEIWFMEVERTKEWAKLSQYWNETDAKRNN